MNKLHTRSATTVNTNERISLLLLFEFEFSLNIASFIHGVLIVLSWLFLSFRGNRRGQVCA